MPTVFKAGKWNPDTEIVEEEIEKFGNSSEPDFSCSKLSNMRNLHRAVNIGDAKLLKNLVLDKKNIANLCHPWSKDSPYTIAEMIALK